MQDARLNDIYQFINDDPELRKVAYEHARQMRARRAAEEAAEAERERVRPERLKAFWQMLGIDPAALRNGELSPREKLLAMSPAEAWMSEHPEEFNLETAPTVRAAMRLVRIERLRLQASRERLKGLGIM